MRVYIESTNPGQCPPPGPRISGTQPVDPRCTATHRQISRTAELTIRLQQRLLSTHSVAIVMLY